MEQTKARLQELTRHHPPVSSQSSVSETSCCTARGCGWTRLSRHSALNHIGRSAHWRPRMAKSGRAGLAPQCPSTQAHGPAPVLQVKTFGVHTSHPRRVGAEHFQRQASTRQPAAIADKHSYLGKVSLGAPFLDTQENTATSRWASRGRNAVFSTRGRPKSRLGVYAAK
jgi:hypothetical protein